MCVHSTMIHSPEFGFALPSSKSWLHHLLRLWEIYFGFLTYTDLLIPFRVVQTFKCLKEYVAHEYNYISAGYYYFIIIN